MCSEAHDAGLWAEGSALEEQVVRVKAQGRRGGRMRPGEGTAPTEALMPHETGGTRGQTKGLRGRRPERRPRGESQPGWAL